MKKAFEPRKSVSAEAIARSADQGKDISGFFKGQGRMVEPIQHVKADFTPTRLKELNRAAADLKVSR
jgi:hypothetical protein